MTYRSLFPVLVLAACSGGGSAPVQEPPEPQPVPQPQPQPDPVPQPPAADPTAEFARFVDDYFAGQYAFSPSEGTGTGFHEYDFKIEDRSRARIEARIAELKAQLARLQKIDRSKLGFDDAIDAEALEGQIRGTLLDLDVLKLWKTNPMAYSYIGGGAIDVLMKREFAPADHRVRAVIARLQGIPAIYDAARANVENPPREFTDIAILMVKGSIRSEERRVGKECRSRWLAEE